VKNGMDRKFWLVNSLAMGACALLFILFSSVVEHQGSGMLALLILVLFSLIVVLFMIERRGHKFDIFQPLIFLGVFYFLPMFVLKPLAVMSLSYENQTLDLLSDQSYYVKLAMVTSILSLLSLSIGFYLPIGKRISSHLPRLEGWHFTPNQIKLASLCVYAIGFVSTVYLFAKGRVGFTAAPEGSITFLNILQHVSRFTAYGMFLSLWAYLGLNSKRTGALLIFVAAILGQTWWMFAMGSRAQLFSIALIILGVRQYSLYPHVSYKKLCVAGSYVVLSLLVGIVIGTSFREEKLKTVGIGERINAKDVVTLNRDVLDKLSSLSILDIKEIGEQTIVRRMDSLDSLAVILNYSEGLKAAEEGIGISDNIVKNLLWGLVPRFMWPEKPTISDFAIKFGNLYRISSSEFNFQAVTVMGDLYRNFGMVGVIIGMLIMGIALRTIYGWLVERENPGVFCFFVYFFLLTSVNFEDQYSEFFTNAIRTLLFLLISGIIIRFIGRARGLLKNPMARGEARPLLR
jgi:hypothetical protein